MTGHFLAVCLISGTLAVCLVGAILWRQEKRREDANPDRK